MKNFVLLLLLAYPHVNLFASASRAGGVGAGSTYEEYRFKVNTLSRVSSVKGVFNKEYTEKEFQLNLEGKKGSRAKSARTLAQIASKALMACFTEGASLIVDALTTILESGFSASGSFQSTNGGIYNTVNLKDTTFVYYYSVSSTEVKSRLALFKGSKKSLKLKLEAYFFEKNTQDASDRKVEESKENQAVQVVSGPIFPESNRIYALRSIKSACYLDGRLARVAGECAGLAGSKRNPHHDQYLQWTFWPIESGGAFALKSVSSSLYLSGKPIEGSLSQLSSSRDPQKDDTLHWKLVHTGGNPNVFGLQNAFSTMWLGGISPKKMKGSAATLEKLNSPPRGSWISPSLEWKIISLG